MRRKGRQRRDERGSRSRGRGKGGNEKGRKQGRAGDISTAARTIEEKTEGYTFTMKGGTE